MPLLEQEFRDLSFWHGAETPGTVLYNLICLIYSNMKTNKTHNKIKNKNLSSTWIVNELLVRNGSDFIAQTFEYHFFDQRLALVLFKRDPVLPNHGIHRFLLILQGFWSKIAPEKASPADGLSRGNIGQIEPGAKDGSRF